MKLGCLPYLNVKPLVYPFEHGELPEGWELVYEPPSRLAQMLARREIAAAPVSSFACLSDPNLWAVPGICIASKGPVKSVLVVSKVAIPTIESIAVDTGSLSGAAMSKILLSELYGLRPRYIPTEPDPERMLELADAALLIGNPALLMAKDRLHVFDIGAGWLELTGLPAVFAVWAGRKEALVSELITSLERAKEIGLKKIEEISREESAKLGVSYDFCFDYLANVMSYDLGWKEIQSLELFAEKAHEHGLTECAPGVRVVGMG